jgi:PadR family transcriptional regulator PadR
MVDVDDVGERTTLMLRGSLDLCVLAVLREQPLHAYGIVQRLAEHGISDVSYGTVYPLTTRLRRLGLVEQRLGRGHGGPARNVLSLTSAGTSALRRWAAHWHQHQDRVSTLLDEALIDEEQAHG